ncbi:tRNA lysidine(34) synthetase TilS [Thiohalocapsa sp. ML1]|jgi:tRNA(Ile)-lysidine synthase|uniref:tRNA lysidine(34) synthetase TilS n=1 Tax=Thiohalocapsa sp. ML1 TaxID=1431688 RepID=UPI000731F13B|nr:tRNA lysidine(34) synthetase TilS [Thiohalocapsa sp. ML1]
MRAADRLDPARLAAALAPARGGRLWIAYSGGLDSHVLLHAAAGLGRALGAELRAVHIHHGLQTAADAWVAHCEQMCAALGVALDVRHLRLAPAPGESLEAVARDARYAAFRALLSPGDCIASAHHRDDQAETLLLALLRGAGVHGLAAMPHSAALGAGRLLRPLLDLPRAALVEYAAEHGLCWIDDPSNQDPVRDRNRLRSLIIPSIKARWPALDRTAARTASHCAEAAALLDGFADELLAGLGADAAGGLPAAGLLDLDAARRRLVLRRWLARQGFLPPPADRLQRIADELLPVAPDRQPLVAWSGCEVRRHRRHIYALAPLPPAPPTMLEVGAAPVLVLPAGLGELSWALAAAGQRQVSVGFGLPGLRCARQARPSATLKALYQQAGVPAWLRPYVPLVLVDGQLAGAGGVALCGTALGRLRWSGHPWQQRGWFAEEVSA